MEALKLYNGLLYTFVFAFVAIPFIFRSIGLIAGPLISSGTGKGTIGGFIFMQIVVLIPAGIISLNLFHVVFQALAIPDNVFVFYAITYTVVGARNMFYRLYTVLSGIDVGKSYTYAFPILEYMMKFYALFLLGKGVYAQ